MSCLARYVKIQWVVPVINLLPLIQIHPSLTCFGTLEQDPVNISPLPAVSVNNRGHLEGPCQRMGLLSLLLGCFVFLLQCGCKRHERGRTECTLQWVCPANFSVALQAKLWPCSLQQDLNLSLVWWVPSSKVFVSSLDIPSLNPGGGSCFLYFLVLCSLVSYFPPFS